MHMARECLENALLLKSGFNNGAFFRYSPMFRIHVTSTVWCLPLPFDRGMLNSLMSLFHSGMNHWQRQWLHGKNATPPVAKTPISITPKPKRKTTRAKKTQKAPKGNTQ